MTTRSKSASEQDAQVQTVVSELVASMSARLVTESRNIRRVLERDISELGGDDRLLELLGASVESNVDTVFHVLAHGITPDKLNVPVAAMEYARRSAQHAIPVTALVRAYRLGQSVFLDRVFDEIAESAIEPALGLRVSQRVMSVGSSYIDWISEQVVDAYQNERERWLSNRNNIRAVRIRELLTSTTHVDDAATSAAIGYNLDQNHCALIAWLPGSDRDDTLSQLERRLRHLATLLGATGDPLFVASDQSTAWLWVPRGTNPDSPDTTAAAEFLRSGSAAELQIAMGSCHHGSTGFRTSHLHARHTRTIMTRFGVRTAPPLASYADPGLAAASLLTTDPARAREWVRTVLGSLADDTDHAERLRTTLQVFLAHQSSHKAAAQQLHVHYNTIKYRIKAAEHERGKPLSVDRLDVEMALLARQWLPTASGSSE